MNTENRNPETGRVPVAAPPATPESPVTNPPARASRRGHYLVLGGVAAVLIAGLVSGIVPRIRAQGRLAAGVHESPRQTVSLTNATWPAKGLEVTLPGDVLAFEQTEIYARADGYLLKWHTDIGAKVEAGQLLAEIDTPELDQDLNRSRAALAQAQANLTLARSSAVRWEGLIQDHAVSQQEVDEKTGALAAREADVKAAEATVRRLEKLASFKEVRAPFAGKITRRLVDTGALIHAGMSGGASALFQLAQMDTLRVQVNTPQTYLRDIAIGAPVQVRVAEYPERAFPGQVSRTSGAFDPLTRTLLTEIEVPNGDGALFPGIHVDVQLSLTQAHPPLIVPATSVLIRSDGPQLAVLDPTDAIRLQKVQLGRDFGQTVEILSGLEEGARIVAHPTDTLIEGTQVKLAGLEVARIATPQLARHSPR